MINIIKLGFVPHTCCWVHRKGLAQGLLAVLVYFTNLMLPINVHALHSSDSVSGTIRFYDGRGGDTPLDSVETLHRFPVHLMAVSTTKHYPFSLWVLISIAVQ